WVPCSSPPIPVQHPAGGPIRVPRPEGGGTRHRRRFGHRGCRCDVATMSGVGEEAPYPDHREADVVLRDGSTVHVRPIRPEDRDALGEFWEGLSKESLALRFFTAAVDLGWVVERMADMDQHGRFGLLATMGERPVAHAVFIATAEDRAEMALA